MEEKLVSLFFSVSSTSTNECCKFIFSKKKSFYSINNSINNIVEFLSRFSYKRFVLMMKIKKKIEYLLFFCHLSY